MKLIYALMLAVPLCALSQSGSEPKKSLDHANFTIINAPATTGLVIVTSMSDPNIGLRIDRMSDEEYAKLQAARKALADTEATIEKAHGADLRTKVDDENFSPIDHLCVAPYELHSIGWDAYGCYYFRTPDTVEFRGQFLLVQSAATEGGGK